MNNLPEPDALDALLTPTTPLAGNEPLRQVLLLQTTRVLRRRRRLKQAGFVAALTGCFLAGIMVVRYVVPAAGSREVVQQPVVPDETPALPAPAVQQAGLQAVVLEWQAFDSPDQRAELYRRAGDLYVSEGCDPHAALRCYQNALDNGSDGDLVISADDNWLLMALKNDRQKEKRYARNGD